MVKGLLLLINLINITTVKKRVNSPIGYKAVISIANTNLESLKYIQFLCGGKIITDAPRRGYEYKKQLYILRITGFENIKGLLEQILPFLIIKKHKGEILLQYINSRLNKRDIKCRYRLHDTKELMLIQAIRCRDNKV